MIRIGPFDLDAPIGRGGMGEVWRATHRASLAPVAIKLLHPHLGRSDRHSARLRTEVRAMARLDHPAIAHVLDTGEVPQSAADASSGHLVAGSAWVAMELASGGSLAERVGLLDWTALRSALLAILDGLSHAHARGVIHRDLKPGNVLLALPTDLRPGWKISDFGMARALGDPATSSGPGVAGTPLYMAPEQIDGELAPQGPWTDLYALGCIGWALACGRSPFGQLRGVEAAMAHVSRPLPTFEPVVPVRAGLEEWLRRLLEKPAQRRFPSAADAAAVLRDLGEPSMDADEESERGGAADRWPGRTPGRHQPAAWQARVPVFPRVLRGAGVGLVSVRVPRFVGRQKERKILWEILHETAASSRPRAVVVRGPPGIGRTRIAAWLGERAHEIGVANTVMVRAAPQEPAEHALDGLVRQLLHAQRRQQTPYVESMLGSVAPLDDATMKAVGAILAGDAVESHVRRSTVRALVERRAAGRALVVVLDDVHNAPELVGFVRSMLQDLPRSPIVWIVTVPADALVGTDLTALLATLSPMEIELHPLEPLALAALVQEQGLATSLGSQLYETTGGNPKALTDRLADWAARGWLVPAPTGIELQAGVDAWAEPSPDDLWAGQLERVLESLPLEAEEALEVAAALGVRVAFDEWEAVANSRGEPIGVAARAGLLDRLISMHLVEETTDAFAFSHHGLPDAVARRARARGTWELRHAACAEMLAARPVRDPTRLGQHLARAGRADAAVGQLIAGADIRARTAGTRPGLALLAQAERALVEAGGEPSDPRWGELALRYARLYGRIGEVREARVWAERAAAAAHRAGRPEIVAQARVLRAMVALIVLDLDRAEREFTDAVELGEKCRCWPALGEAWLGLSRVAAALGRDEVAIQRALKGQSAWERADVLEADTEKWRCAAFAAALGRDWDVARAALAEGRKQARAARDGHRELPLLELQTRLERHEGSMKTAEALVREWIERAEQLGSVAAVRGWCELALILLAGARWPAAHTAIAVEGARIVPPPGSVSAELRPAIAAAAAAAGGHWDQAGHHVAAAEASAPERPIGLPDAEWCLGLAGDRAAASGQVELARRCARLVADHRSKPIGLI
jgi:hypothetical protein